MTLIDNTDINTHKYLPPTKAQQQVGISARTLARWLDSGKVKEVRLPSGIRLYDEDSVIILYLGYSVIYVSSRISSHVSSAVSLIFAPVSVGDASVVAAIVSSEIPTV